MPLRLTPTRITSAPCRSRLLWPSSCARLKLIASIRSLYSLLLLTSLNRPTRCSDLMPSSFSSGCTKVPNMSSSMPLQPSCTTRSTSMLTRVVKTMGLRPSTSATWLTCRTAWKALSTVSMKGSRTWRGLNSNCDRIAMPKASAVMPVPSEMKKTVRVCMGGRWWWCGGGRGRAVPGAAARIRAGRPPGAPGDPDGGPARVCPGALQQSMTWARRPRMPGLPAYFSRMFSDPPEQDQSPRQDMRARPPYGGGDPVSTSGAFPCLHALKRPRWSYRSRT